MTIVSNQSAIAHVRTLARSLGIDCEPALLADRSNLVLELKPHPIVARVAMATSMVRAGIGWLRREVDISGFLDARGGAVTRPTLQIEPGPFERDGLIVSFWELEQVVSDAPDAKSAGKSLAELHNLLANYPTEELPDFGAWDEARVVFERARANPFFTNDERRRIERAWDASERIALSAKSRTRSFQIVHGDAHLRNVIQTARGTLWTDWEDAFVGPIEWDIACVRSRLLLFGEEREAIDDLCAAYTNELNQELCEELGLVRNVQVILWLAVFSERDPSLLSRMRARITRLPSS